MDTSIINKLKKEYNLNQRLNEEAKEQCEESMFAFFVHAWDILEPHTKFLNNWHIGLICEYLEAIYSKDINKVIFNIPPRYLKSMLITINYPAWVWTKQPWHRFASWSYSDDISSKLSFKRRQLIESRWYKSFWNDKVQLLPDQNQKTFYQNSENGFMFATSTGGTFTGEGCDTQIIDDPTKPLEAESDVQRKKATEFWKSTASSRFNNPKTSSLILVMQRLHENDLTGYFIAEESGFTHVKIPNIGEEEKTIYSYPKTGRVKIYSEDEILQPEREGTKELDNQKKTLGSYGFAAQRQQNPAPRKGGLVQGNWFNFYDTKPTDFKYVGISVDCAFKGLDESDYVVFQAWGVDGVNKYLLAQLRSKLSFNETVKALRNFISRFPQYDEVLIEEKANGAAVIDTLKIEFTSIIPINPKDSKITRLNAVVPIIEAGEIWLPKYESWVKDFIHEVCTFPKGAHDDQVDAMTQMLNRLRSRNVGTILDDMIPNGSNGTLTNFTTGNKNEW